METVTQGTLLSVDGNKLVVTRLVGRFLRLVIDPEAKLFYDGKPITVDQLAAGQFVQIVFWEDTAVAHQVNVYDEKNPPDLERVKGVVSKNQEQEQRYENGSVG